MGGIKNNSQAKSFLLPCDKSLMAWWLLTEPFRKPIHHLCHISVVVLPFMDPHTCHEVLFHCEIAGICSYSWPKCKGKAMNWSTHRFYSPPRAVTWQLHGNHVRRTIAISVIRMGGTSLKYLTILHCYTHVFSLDVKGFSGHPEYRIFKAIHINFLVYVFYEKIGILHHLWSTFFLISYKPLEIFKCTSEQLVKENEVNNLS